MRLIPILCLAACSTVVSRPSADVLEGELPLDVTFDATGSRGVLHWDFGDGETSTEPAPTHTYLRSGTFTATLTVSGNEGDEMASSVEIVVRTEDCPEWDDDGAPTLSADAITEASGLVFGEQALWTHNDSGGTARLFALDSDGALLGTLELTNAPARDWEDIATWGPLLVIADVGDNDEKRTDARLIIVAEPEGLEGGEVLQTTEYLVLPLDLDAPANIEAVAIDPQTDALVLLTKSEDGAHLLIAEPGWADEDVVRPIDHGTILFGEGDLPGSPLATGMDIDPVGHRIVVQTYTGPWLFRRDGELADAFFGTPCEVPGMLEQNEAVAIDGPRLYTLPEGQDAPLRRLVERVTE